MTREDILDKALNLITGDRAKQYGDAKDNHIAIATGWNHIVQRAYDTHGTLTPEHVALMMDWLKTCRLLTDVTHEDSWVDKAGYTALGGEIATKD
jgi:hypothetical protein